MHRIVRKTFLVVLAQLARRAGLRHGLDLQPISNDPAMPKASQDFLQLKPMPSHGQVVAFDVNEVSIDLEAVSLDEVLRYRSEHGDILAAPPARHSSLTLPSFERRNNPGCEGRALERLKALVWLAPGGIRRERQLTSSRRTSHVATGG